MSNSVKNNTDFNNLFDQALNGTTVAEPPPKKTATQQAQPKQKATNGFDFSSTFDESLKKKVGGNESSSGVLPSPEDINAASLNYQNKTLKPEDAKTLANTDFGYAKGWMKLTTVDDFKHLVDVHNSTPTPDEVDNKVKAYVDNFLPDINPIDAKKYAQQEFAGQVSQRATQTNISDAAQNKIPISAGINIAQTKPVIFSDEAAAEKANQQVKKEMVDGIKNGDIKQIATFRNLSTEKINNQIDEINKNPQGNFFTSGISSAGISDSKIELSDEQKQQIKNLNQQKDDIEKTLSGYVDKSLVQQAYKKVGGLRSHDNLLEIGKQKRQYEEPIPQFEGEQEVTNTLAKTYQNYNDKQTGIDAAINTLSMDYAANYKSALADTDVSAKDRVKDNAELINDLIAQKANLPNEYLPVQVNYVARLMGDKISSFHPVLNVFITDADRQKAIDELEKENPGFTQKYSTAIKYINDNGGIETSIPHQGFIGAFNRGGVEASEGILNSVKDYFGLRNRSDRAADELIKQYSAYGSGTSFAGTTPDKIIVDKEGLAFKQIPNENYGKTNFNTIFNGLGEFTGGIIPFALLTEGTGELGGVVGKAAKLPLSKALQSKIGVTGATYLMNYDHNLEQADKLILDNTGAGDFKRGVVANLMTLGQAAAFNIMPANEFIRNNFTVNLAKDAAKFVEGNALQNGLNKDALSKWLDDIVKPRTLASLKIAGVETAQNVGKLDAAMLLQNHSNAIVSSLFDETGQTKNNDVIQQDIQTLKDATLGGLFFALPKLAHTPFSMTARDALYDHAQNADENIARINELQTKGLIAPEQANGIIKLINTARKNLSALTATNEKGLPTSLRQRKIELAELVRKDVLDEITKEVPNSIEQADASIKNADENIKNVVNETPYIDLSKLPIMEELNKNYGITNPLDIDPTKEYDIDGKKVSGDNIISEVQNLKTQDELDAKIKAQQEKLGLPTAPELYLSDNANTVIDKINKGENILNEDLDLLSSELYKRYKTLSQTKDEIGRRYTREQYNNALKDLENKITVLEDHKNKQAEADEFVTINKDEFNNTKNLNNENRTEGKLIQSANEQDQSKHETGANQSNGEAINLKGNDNQQSGNKKEGELLNNGAVSKEAAPIETITDENKISKIVEQKGNAGSTANNESTSKPSIESIPSKENVGEVVQPQQEELNVLTMLHDSKLLSPIEKKTLYRQYKNGVMSENEISKYTNIHVEDLQSGNMKWAQVILDKNKGKEINAEDIDFEEIAPEPTLSNKDNSVEHAQNIKDKFREQFKAKGNSDEHIDAAIALMDARAKSWASEEKGRSPEQWYRQIADIKSGEFEASDIQYQKGGLKAIVAGVLSTLHPIEIKENLSKISAPEFKTETKITPSEIEIKDNRTIDAISGNKLSDTKRLSTKTDSQTIKDIVHSSIQHKIDPYTMLAIAMNESGISGEEGNPMHAFDETGHVITSGSHAEDLQLLDTVMKKFTDKMKIADNLNKKSEADRIQAYNGYGKVGSHTEGEHKSYYGIDVSKEPIDMNKNPVYGKRIIDIRDNIIKKNPELVKLVEDEKRNAIFSGVKDYNTKLTSEENTKYEAWKSKLPKELQNDYDYDLRGLWKENPNQKPSENMHFPDKYKKPNHYTFSDESRYSNKAEQGGQWKEVNGKWTFHASDFNLTQHSKADLLDYFKKYEADSKLILPDNTNVSYQQQQGAKRGALETLKDGRVIIHALDAPDVSTMVHEIGHVFEKGLTEAEQKIVKDFGGSEPFARGFEKYLRDGKAPTPELKILFDKFKQWLTNIYQSLKGSPIAKKISPEIKQIFDRLLTEKKSQDAVQEQTTAESVLRNEGVRGESGLPKMEQNDRPKSTPEEGQKEKGIAAKGKELADKIRQLKTKQDILQTNIFGIPIAIYDDAIETAATAIEKGSELAEAIQKGIDYIGKKAGFDEENFRKHIEDFSAGEKPKIKVQVTGEGEPPKPPTPTTESFADNPNKSERTRGAYEHILDSNIDEDVKQKFKDNGIKYKIAKNESAQKIGRAMVDAYGTDEALKLARLNTFHASVNSAVFAEAINDYYNKEKSATTPQEKFDAAARWADTYNEYAELLTAAGQFGQYAYQFYKTSPLGFILSAKERLDERRKYFVAKDEKSLREAFEAFKDIPEFRDLFSQEVTEAAKKVKREVKAADRQKIKDAWDKLKLDKNTTYATLVPPQVINGAIEVMKQAHLLGYEVADILKEGVKYINERHKEGWDEKKFKEDFKPIVENLLNETTTHKSRLEFYKDNIKKQIESLDKQIENKKRETKKQNKTELDDEAKDLIKQRDEKKKQLNEVVPPEKTAEDILKKWDKKLTKLEPAARKELLTKVLNEIVKNGGLEYDRFKEMYADALGLPSLTPTMEAKLHDLGNKLNQVDIARENLDKNPTQENIDAFKKAMREGTVASTQINDLLGDKGITLDRFLSIAKLNTLGVANLFINPFFNVWFMPIRFLESMVKMGLDYGLKYAGLERADGIYENTFYKQRGYLKGFLGGSSKAVRNIYTGDAQFDYFQKSTRQNIQPLGSAKEIIAHHKGEKKLTNAEYANAVMEALPMMGGTAAIISRGLQLGDLPFRFAAERSMAESIALQKGLSGVAKEAFILSPDEVSAEKIRDAGQRAVMAQDNILTSALNNLSSYLKHATKESIGGKIGVGVTKIIGATTQPFLKIPLNSAMSAFELAVPEFSILKGIYHAIHGNRDLALNAFSRAVVGFALGMAASQIAKAGLVTTTSGDEKKIGTSIYQGDVVGSQTLNYTGFKRWLRGGSTEFADGDVTVNMNWLGIPGAIMQMYGQKNDEMTAEQWDKQGYLANLFERMDGSFVNGLKNNVFNNTSTLLQAMDGGGAYFVNKWLRGSTGILENAFDPSWLSTASRISDHYKADYSAMNLGQQLSATLKERFWNGDNLPKQITVWGEKRTDAPKGTNPFLYYYADITKHRNVDTKDFGYNILALYNRTKQDEVIPSRPSKTFQHNNTSIKLDPYQYEEFQTMVGQNRKQLTQALMNTDTWNVIGDEQKVDYLSKIYKSGYSLGKAEFLMKHPELDLPPTEEKK